MAVASQAFRSVRYCRRHLEQTAFDQVVQQQLKTYLAHAGEDGWEGQRLPADVEREFRRYLERRTLANRFVSAGPRTASMTSRFPSRASRRGAGAEITVQFVRLTRRCLPRGQSPEVADCCLSAPDRRGSASCRLAEATPPGV